MKKILCIVLSVAMFFTLGISAAAYTINKDDAEIGAGDIFGTAAVYFADATVTAGETVTVDLVVENNSGFTEMNITVAADSGVSVQSVANGDLGTVAYANGVITVIGDSKIEADGCIAKVTLAAETEGEKSVVLTVSAKNGENLVSINGSSCVVNVTAAEATVVKGDVDGDGDRDTADLATLKLLLAGAKTAADENVVNPDVDGSGEYNTTDLAKLKLMLAGAEV